MKYICDNCGKKYYRRPSIANRYEIHFCSQKCYHDYRRKKYAKIGSS